MDAHTVARVTSDLLAKKETKLALELLTAATEDIDTRFEEMMGESDEDKAVEELLSEEGAPVPSEDADDELDELMSELEKEDDWELSSETDKQIEDIKEKIDTVDAEMTGKVIELAKKISSRGSEDLADALVAALL